MKKKHSFIFWLVEMLFYFVFETCGHQSVTLRTPEEEPWKKHVHKLEAAPPSSPTAVVYASTTRALEMYKMSCSPSCCCPVQKHTPQSTLRDCIFAPLPCLVTLHTSASHSTRWRNFLFNGSSSFHPANVLTAPYGAALSSRA